MNWEEVCADPVLKNLPYKIELNKWGNIVMTPSKKNHVLYQEKISEMLNSLKINGMVYSECPIMTKENIKVVDIAWASDNLTETPTNDIFYTAPELCIEVMSSYNSWNEMEEKKELYFDAGANEVWLCQDNGDLFFYSKQGVLRDSILFPKFPTKITLDHS